MKQTLFNRLKPENLAILENHSCEITKGATKILLDENYHIMFLPFIAILNLGNIFNLKDNDVLTINNLFNDPEKI